MSVSTILFTILAVFAGTLFPIQTAVNSKLAAGVGGPVLATCISFAAGLMALVVALLFSTRNLPNWDSLRHIPPWLFAAGGLLGATYLALNVFLVPRIGTGAMMGLAVAGQMFSALTIDSVGLFGVAARDLSSGRILGAAMVAIGAIMVRFL